MSRQRLISTVSFQAGRTIGVAGPPETACNWPRRSGISLGECSVSSSSQSNPLSPTMSAAMLLHRLHHKPICSLPAAMACLKELRGRSIGCVLLRARSRKAADFSHEMMPALRSDELDRDAAERTEIAVQRVAFLGEHDAGERAGEHEVAG